MAMMARAAKQFSITVAGRPLETDANGYLVNWSDWSEAAARTMAHADGCELTPAHWEVITFLREYYQEYKIAPAVRVLVKAIGRLLGADKGNSKYLYNLFPYGPAKQACRYAGLPKPTGCI